MNHFVLAFAVAEVLTFIVVGIVTAKKALEGFGMTAITWCVAWFCIMMVMQYIATGNKMVTWAPMIACLIAIGNGLVFYAAFHIERKFERKKLTPRSA